jgi:hypothetical protein
VSVNYNATVRTNRLQQVLNAIDSGPSNGFLQLTDASGNVLSSMQLARPSAIVANALMTFQGLPLIDPAAAAGGAASFARVEDSLGNIVISGLSIGTDLLLSPSAVIAAGQTIALTAATIQGN